MQAYFFAADELRRLMTGCGFEVESLGFEDRAMENKKEGKVWSRRWVQAVFRKPKDSGATATDSSTAAAATDSTNTTGMGR